MSGTKTGGAKAAQTNKEKFGADYYANIGAMGGRAKNPNKGFGQNRELASRVGRIGGLKSRRYKNEESN